MKKGETPEQVETRLVRSKPAAADPWQALPRLADLFDSQTPQPFFKGSKVSALEESALTETQLLEQTAALLGVSLAQLVKAGTLVYAKREFLNHNKYSAAEGGDSESALLRSGSGVAGVADARILAAYQVMADANPPIPITPAKLATRALTGYPTALRWLKIHHPELLVSKPDEASAAPVAVAPACAYGSTHRPTPRRTYDRKYVVGQRGGAAVTLHEIRLGDWRSFSVLGRRNRAARA